MCARAVDERRWVAVFDSVHYVLAAEKLFKERGVWCSLVPVPRQISSDCGMALEFRERDLAAAREALGDARVRPAGVYRPAARRQGAPPAGRTGAGRYEAVSL